MISQEVIPVPADAARSHPLVEGAGVPTTVLVGQSEGEDELGEAIAGRPTPGCTVAVHPREVTAGVTGFRTPTLVKLAAARTG